MAEKLDKKYLEELDVTSVDFSKIITAEDFKDILDESWILDESEEALDMLSEDEEKSLKDFEQNG